jgi:predicted transcriptional regulator
MARRAEWRHQMTLEGLREVDEGRFVNHEAIEKWAAGLK